MKRVLQVILIGLMITVNTAMSFAQGSSDEQELIALSAKKWTWMSAKNLDTLDSLFHEKSVYIHMSGSWDKKRELEVIKTGRIWYKKADVHEVSVNVVQQTAVLLSRIDLLAVVGGNEVTNPFIVSEVYVKEASQWKLLSLAFTKIITR